MYKNIEMKIEIEDIIFGSLALISVMIWYFSVLFFEYPLISIIFLWTSMILISVLYIYVYRRKKRNIRILRIRFFVSGIPIYPTMIYYVYRLIFENGLPKGQEFLPLFVILPALFLNGIVLLFYDIRKNN
jgi:hypothetical protein